MHCWTLPPILQQAITDPYLHGRLLDPQGQVWVSLLWSHCSFLLGPVVYKLLFGPSQGLFPQSCVSSGGSKVGLMVTSSKRAYCTQSPCPTAVCCWPVLPQETLKHNSGSVTGSWCAQALFEPSEHLWRVWGLILNVILPLLPSCWASPLPLDVGYLFGGIQHSVNSCQSLNRFQRSKLDKTRFLLLLSTVIFSLDYQKPNLEDNWEHWCRSKNPVWNTWSKQQTINGGICLVLVG